MTVHDFYTAAGGDYADALDRLKSDAAIARFLKMLPRDGSMPRLRDAMAARDAAGAFRAVHTLKGVSLNLSLTSLATVCSDMTEALRSRAEMPDTAEALFQAVEREYGRVRAALEQLEN